MGFFKTLGIIIVVLLVIAAGIGIYAYFVLNKGPAAAVVYVQSGDVEVFDDKWHLAENGQELKIGNKVRTTDGTASIVFLEGEVMQLQPNSEVEIRQADTKKISVYQSLGESWNSVTKISGVKEYVVETPNTVASVRGTEFIISDDTLLVDKGIVEIEFKDNNEKLSVGANNGVKNRVLVDLNENDTAKFQLMYVKKLEILIKARERIAKNSEALKMAKSQFGFTDNDVQKALDQADAELIDIDAQVAKLPTKPAELNRAILLTKEIQKEIKLPENKDARDALMQRLASYQ